MTETAYKLHFKTTFQGIPISVETRKGSYRWGVDRDGNEWKNKMDFHYGRIPRTRGYDGDMVDVFIGPDKNAQIVYVIEQVWPDTGKFDEHKAMMGFRTKAEAIRGYKSQYNRPGFYGGCLTMTVPEFKEWLKEQSPAKVKRRNLENRIITGRRVIDMIVTDKESNFDKLVKKLMKENGYSEDRAKRIAYSIGVKKYGKAGMTARSVAGRKNDELPEELEDEYLGWDKLVKQLVAEGKSKESAENIAASIGRKKYGKAGMAKKAAAGRDSEILPVLQAQGKHKGADYSQYSPKELALGILVEKEHADDIPDRLEIAADHLEEKGNYYSDPDSFFIDELRSEYDDNFQSAYAGALKIVRRMLGTQVIDSEVTDSMVKDSMIKDSDANTVILEAMITPIIKKLMLSLGFKKLFWRGSGWVIPIGLDEYGSYLKMIPQLKVYDRMLQKFGYEISLAPGWFKIVPVSRG